MNQLVSMLVPLETLPGWPVAPTVSWLHAIGLLIGLPLLVIIIISTIGKVGAKRNAGRSHDFDDQFGLSGGSAGSGGSISGASGSAALTSGSRGSAQPAAGEQETKVGGASARW